MNLDACQMHIDFLEKDYLNGVHALPTNQSASALEALPAPSIVASLSTITNIPAAGPSTSKKTADESHAAKPPRKSRVPKGVVPGVTPLPDPERWLKKRERTSTTRHEGGRRRKGAGMGVGATQGAAVNDPIPSSSVKTASGSGASSTGQSKKGKKGK